jgi:hypothetical protein
VEDKGEKEMKESKGLYVIIRSNRLTTNKEKDSSLSQYRG